MEKISQLELSEKLSDPNTSITDISKYFRSDKNQSRPFSPRFEIDPEKVERSVDLDGDAQLEGFKFWVGRLNNWHRRRRQRAYEKKISDGWSGLRFVAEGDSWFQYPIRETDDLIDFLDDKYAIYCISAASDEFSNMLKNKDDIAAAIKNTNANGLLFSGGGNDIVGKTFTNYLKGLNADFQAKDYISYKFDNFIELADQQFVELFEYLLEDRSDLKIFYHGYDRSFPRDNGDYLGPQLNEKGIPPKFWHEIITIMIDRYNVMLTALAQRYPNNLYHVDCRGSVGRYEEWRDELHALEGGCRRAAQKFDDAIGLAFSNIEIATATDDQFESIGAEDLNSGADDTAELTAPDPLFENISEEASEEGDLVPGTEIGIEDAVSDASQTSAEYENFEAALSTGWAKHDKNSTEYAHLSNLPKDQHFKFTPEDLELLVDLNHFELQGHQEKIVFGLRGAAIKSGHQVENVNMLELKDLRPDHVNLRCVIGFYDFVEKKFWAYTASTVPNARNMHAYYRKVHGISGRKLMSNMLPSGAYTYRRASHGWDRRRNKWKVPRALRLTNSGTKSDGKTIVLRSRNDLVYGNADYWQKTTPMDNIHPAFSTTTFSSAGCLTIRGTNQRYTNSGSAQWKRFLIHISQMGSGDPIDLLLLTGSDAATITKFREDNNIGNQSMPRENLERLRIGSTGNKVKKLQSFLEIDQTGIFDPDTKLALIEMQMTIVPIDRADGIYSPKMDELFGADIMTVEDDTNDQAPIPGPVV